MKKSSAGAIGGVQSRQLRSLFGVVFAAVVLSGCGAGHFYHPENDKTAAAAKEASDQLDLVDVITQERSNQAKLLTHEIAVVSDFAVTRRNTALRALLEDRILEDGSIESLSVKLRRFIDARLEKIADTSNPEEVTAILALESSLRGATENLQTERQVFRSGIGVEAPVCPTQQGDEFNVTSEMIDDVAKRTVAAGRDVSRATIESWLEDYESLCTSFQEAWKGVTSVEGWILVAVERWRKAIDTTQDQAAKAETARSRYKTALQAYSKAAKSAQKDASADAKEALKQSIESVREALGALAAASDLGNLEAASEQIGKVDTLLEAAASGELDEEKLKSADDDTKWAVAVAAQLPSLFGQVVAIGALSKALPVNALLFEKERLLAHKQAAERALERTRTRQTLAERKRHAIVAEIRALANAREHVDWALRENNGGRITLNGLTRQPINETARRYMVMAVAIYLNSYTGPRRLLHETEYRLIDVDHAEALDRSETSLRLWQTAVKQPVTVLAAYHASGLRTEDIIELLKATGLFVIGAGVN